MTEATLKRQYKAYCERIYKAHPDGKTKPVKYELWKQLHLAGLS